MKTLITQKALNTQKKLFLDLWLHVLWTDSSRSAEEMKRNVSLPSPQYYLTCLSLDLSAWKTQCSARRKKRRQRGKTGLSQVQTKPCEVTDELLIQLVGNTFRFFFLNTFHCLLLKSSSDRGRFTPWHQIHTCTGRSEQGCCLSQLLKTGSFLCFAVHCKEHLLVLTKTAWSLWCTFQNI